MMASFLLSFFFVQLLAHDPPSLDQEKQDYIDSYIEIKSVYAKYINTYLDDFAVPAFRYSIKNNGPLDMRMSKKGVTAEHIINSFKL